MEKETTMKLEVGKTYELANGGVHECTRMFGDDPYEVNDCGYGPFEVDGSCYHQDGTHGSGGCPKLNVIRCVEDTVTDSSGCVMCDLGVCDYTPTIWGDMTPEEKGALLLAHHEGKVIEWCWDANEEWQRIDDPIFSVSHAYRIKPEPKVETVVLSGRQLEGDWSFGTGTPWKLDTHSITLTIRNGKVDPVAQVEVLE